MVYQSSIDVSVQRWICSFMNEEEGGSVENRLWLVYIFSDWKWAASWQNQRNGMCAQRRLRSAWASAQTDQSLRCPYKVTLGPQLPIERTAKTLIKLDGCPGWSESSPGAHLILLVLLWGGSNLECYTWFFRVCKSFPVWNSIVSVLDHCLFIYFKIRTRVILRRAMRKCVLYHMRTTTVWSAPLLFAAQIV